MRDREKGTAVDYVGHFEREAAAFEAAVHRWDAENAVGTAGPLDAAFAVDAIGQTFEVLAPYRCGRLPARPVRYPWFR